MADFIGWQGWEPRPDEVSEFVATLPWASFAGALEGGLPQGDEDALLYKAMMAVCDKSELTDGRLNSRNQGNVGSCFPAGTMVVGERTRAIEDVRIGDRVWTGEGRLTEVITTRSLFCREPLVRIKPVGGLELTCTPDHKILVYRMRRVHGKRVNCANYKRAKEGILKGEANRQAVVECYERRTPTWVRADELVDTDCLLTPLVCDVIPEEGKRPAAFSDWLLGYFVGNGHASHGSVEWTTPAHKPTITDEVCNHLRDAGLSYEVRPLFHGTYRVRTHSREFVCWFREQFYDKGKQKVFPGWAVGRTEFFEGLCDADGWTGTGSRHNRERGLDSISLSVIHGANLTLIGMGYEPAQCVWCPSSGRHANAKPLHRLVWTEDKQRCKVWRDEKFVVRAIDKLSRIEGEKIVYDIGVRDDHHSFLANGYAASNCVGNGTASAGDITTATEIVIGRQPERWTARMAADALYGMSRDIVGQLGSWDGSNGSWAARAIREWGTIHQAKYGDLDLTKYSAQRCSEWARRGVPEALKSAAGEHKFGTCAQIKNAEECRAALQNGYGVNVCSNQGFNGKRDSDGFMKPQGSWAHSMAIIAYRGEASGRRGFLIWQSWGNNWGDGPLWPDDMPWASFWADWAVVDRMCKGGDTFGYSNYAGFPRQKLDFDFLTDFEVPAPTNFSFLTGDLE